METYPLSTVIKYRPSNRLRVDAAKRGEAYPAEIILEIDGPVPEAVVASYFFDFDAECEGVACVDLAGRDAPRADKVLQGWDDVSALVAEAEKSREEEKKAVVLRKKYFYRPAIVWERTGEKGWRWDILYPLVREMPSPSVYGKHVFYRDPLSGKDVAFEYWYDSYQCHSLSLIGEDMPVIHLDEGESLPEEYARAILADLEELKEMRNVRIEDFARASEILGIAPGDDRRYFLENWPPLYWVNSLSNVCFCPFGEWDRALEWIKNHMRNPLARFFVSEKKCGKLIGPRMCFFLEKQKMPTVSFASERLAADLRQEQKEE